MGAKVTGGQSGSKVLGGSKIGGTKAGKRNPTYTKSTYDPNVAPF